MKPKTMHALIQSAGHIDAHLIRAVVRQIGGWQSFTESAEDVSNHGIDGGFHGFIYHSDTVPFGRRHRDLIIGFAKEMAEDIGSDSVYSMIAGFNCVSLSADEVAEALYNARSENRTEVFNALAWFIAEETCRAYADR